MATLFRLIHQNLTKGLDQGALLGGHSMRLFKLQRLDPQWARVEHRLGELDLLQQLLQSKDLSLRKCCLTLATAILQRPRSHKLEEN